MAKQSTSQKKTIGRVMHEYKRGQLKSGGGRRQVKSPKQAIAIALSEAGASRTQSPAQKRRAQQRTKTREARGQTARAQTQRRGRKTTARGTTARRKMPRAGAARRTTRGRAGEMTRAQLYQEARRRNIPGRSKMTKDQLAKAVGFR
jgi:hypothetical protein